VTFTGIPIAALDFYEDLEADNTKAFWTAHKQVYDDSVKAPLEALCAALAPEFGTPKLFRPYRDVRFARDKTPYKTHQGVWFEDSHLYLQVSAAGLFLGGGYWRMSSPQITRYRRAVADDVAGAALGRVLLGLNRAKFELGADTLTRVPAGFDKDHPRGDLLRYKSLAARRDVGCPDWLQTKRTQPEIVKIWRKMTPLIAWLDTHVGPHHE
jgi:uncharacterized protein (TIGR02453 family)